MSYLILLITLRFLTTVGGAILGRSWELADNEMLQGRVVIKLCRIVATHAHA